MKRRSFLFSWILAAIPTAAGGFHFRNWIAGRFSNRRLLRGGNRAGLSLPWPGYVVRRSEYMANVGKDDPRWREMAERMVDSMAKLMKKNSGFTGLDSIFAPKPNRQEKRNALLKKLWRARS